MEIIRIGARGHLVKKVQQAVGVKPDGIFGPMTDHAVKKFQTKHNLKPDGVVGPQTWKAIEFRSPTIPKKNRYDKIVDILGVPNNSGSGYLTTIELPLTLTIAWNTKQKTNKMRVHKRYAEQILNIFGELLAVYGQEKLDELGITLFGGCFNYRVMRNGHQMSDHAWAAAIDLDPKRNGLTTKYADAQFSKPEYEDMHHIFEKYGWENLGKTWGRDAMHFRPSEIGTKLK